MAPLTRGRTGATGVPGALVAEYYVQRATAGLLITEATAVNREGDGWPGAPGIYTDAQVEGWRAVAHAVHAAGGRIFVQVWHMGRAVLSRDLDGAQPLGPSEVVATSELRGKDGVSSPFDVPRAMTREDIDRTVAAFTRAAERAVEAGLDGVEIHAANSFLIDTFLRDGTNQRNDAYGGGPENRARFLFEIVDAVSRAIGADRVGVRFSPTNAVYGISDSAPKTTFPTAARMLNRFNLAYLHILEADPDSGHPMATNLTPTAPLIREVFDGPLILNGGYDRNRADAMISTGAGDAVAFGTLFVANPDLVNRFNHHLPLAAPDPGTFYTPGPKSAHHHAQNAAIVLR